MPLSTTKQISVVYTETFRLTARNILDYLSSSVDDPKPIISRQLDEFEEKVSVFPEGCQIAPDLLQLGCDRYRECITRDGYRILYSYDAQKAELTAHTILGRRQSVLQSLFDRLITV